MIRQITFEKTISSIIAEVATDDKVRCAYLFGSDDGGVITIEGIHIPEQTHMICSTRISPEAKARAYMAISDSDKRHKIIGEVVSHGDMEVFESGINQRGRQDLDRTLARTTVLLVVNNKGDHKIFFEKPKCVCECECSASQEVIVR